MTVTNNNKRLLHRKEWQMMTPTPTTTAAGSFVITDPVGLTGNVLYVASATVQYGYSAQEDAWLQIPSMALAGTFGAGACGAYSCWSNTLTANGGSASTITTATAINSFMEGATIEILSGTYAGERVTVTSAKIIPGGTNTINFSPSLGGAILTGVTFRVNSGRFFIMNAGTTAAGIFKSYDPLTGVTTTLGTTNLPASWGTDGRLVATPSSVGTFANGTATSGGASTITNSAKTWAANQWTNYQIRITAGTGKGQIRTVASNTTTQVTVSSVWTVQPDNTSEYAFEGNDDFLYLIGNNAVTMYRYSISGNTWTVMSPTSARGAAMVTGGGANWVGKTGDSIWGDESNIQDGRYIYSFRGGGSSALDRFDIAGGTSGAGAWGNVAYIFAQETFTTGSSYDMLGDKLFIRKDATNRFFYYHISGNNTYPFNTNLYTDGIALNGDKIFTCRYSNDGGVTYIDWLYSLRNTGTELHRIMVF